MMPDTSGSVSALREKKEKSQHFLQMYWELHTSRMIPSADELKEAPGNTNDPEEKKNFTKQIRMIFQFIMCKVVSLGQRQ